MLSLVPSGIGFVLFMYGRKQDRWAHLVAGLALMVYPYFVNTVTQMLGAGLLIAVLFWWALRSG